MAEGRGLPYAAQRLPNLNVPDANDDVGTPRLSRRAREQLAIASALAALGVAIGALVAWSWL
jgi:hypothetical protein